MNRAHHHHFAAAVPNRYNLKATDDIVPTEAVRLLTGSPQNSLSATMLKVVTSLNDAMPVYASSVLDLYMCFD